MAVAISTDTVFHSNDIIVGFGHVKATEVNGHVRWELPGGSTTTDYTEAQAVAQRLDRLITRNKERTGCSLLWS